MMILPRVKQYKNGEGAFSGALVLPRTGDGPAAATILSRFLPACSVGMGEAPTVTLWQEEMKAGAYRLTVCSDGIRLEYWDYEGMRNALATLAALEGKGGFVCAEIADEPEHTFRSAMLDLARGYVELAVLREHIVRMARLKYNYLHLHLMDSKSYVMESSVVPNPDGHRQYTQDELRELCAFCREMAVEVIPEIEFPTHAGNLLRAIPELFCDVIDMEKAKALASGPRVNKNLISKDRGISAWAVCLGQDRTYEIYDRIISEVVSVFPGEYLHVGGDEIAYPQFGAVPHWDNCRACRARREKEGLADDLALYHDAFRRLYPIVAAYGKRMIKWNEQEEMAAPPPIPREIVVEYWKPYDPHIINTHPERIEEEKQMMTDAGFTMINAHYYYTYNDENNYMSAEKMNAWSPSAEGQAIMGGETCAWELGNPEYAYYSYRFPLSMALFCDRLWNRSVVPYDSDYRATLFGAILGRGGLGDAPLAPLPDILPPIPRSQAPGAPEERPGEADRALAALAGLSGEEVYGSKFLEAYRAYLLELSQRA